MNPLETKVRELEKKLEELNQEILSLRNPSQIHPDIRKVLSTLTVSSKNANSEDVSVNESGSDSYSVLNDPIGFLQVTISGTTYYLPYYNA